MVIHKTKMDKNGYVKYPMGTSRNGKPVFKRVHKNDLKQIQQKLETKKVTSTNRISYVTKVLVQPRISPSTSSTNSTTLRPINTNSDKEFTAEPLIDCNSSQRTPTSAFINARNSSLGYRLTNTISDDEIIEFDETDDSHLLTSQQPSEFHHENNVIQSPCDHSIHDAPTPVPKKIPEKTCFTDYETELFLELYKDPAIEEMFKNNKKSHKIVWDRLADSLKENNFVFKTGKQLQTRFDNLKQRYFQIKRSIRSGDPEPTWKYWNDFQFILGQRPSCHPVVLRDDLHLDGVDVPVNDDVNYVADELVSNDVVINEVVSNRKENRKRKRSDKNVDNDEWMKYFKESDEKDRELLKESDNRAQLRDDKIVNLLETLVNFTTNIN